MFKIDQDEMFNIEFENENQLIKYLKQLIIDSEE